MTPAREWTLGETEAKSPAHGIISRDVSLTTDIVSGDAVRLQCRTSAGDAVGSDLTVP